MHLNPSSPIQPPIHPPSPPDPQSPVNLQPYPTAGDNLPEDHPAHNVATTATSRSAACQRVGQAGSMWEVEETDGGDAEGAGG